MRVILIFTKEKSRYNKDSIGFIIAIIILLAVVALYLFIYPIWKKKN